MKTNYIIINKKSNNKHILNKKEKENFYKIQCKHNYYELKEEKESFLEELGLGFLAVAIVLLLTEIIMQWI
tara:strand:- start:91 stop:303 length:213 start_codon:yes stop_codon:yes gene_type:complete